MESLLYIFASFMGILLDAVSLAMIIRMLIPLFTDVEDSRFYMFLSSVTEPFIIPVRVIFERLNFLQDSPIDWAFFISYLILSFIRSALPVI